MRVVAFTPDGKRVLTQPDNVVQLWDAATGLRLAETPSRPTFGAALTADGAAAVSGNDDRVLRPWPLSWVRAT